MTEWAIKEKLFYLKNRFYKRLDKRRFNKDILINKLAWTYTVYATMLILAFIGVVLYIGCSYDIPVLEKVASFGGIKYLMGVDKFKVKIDPEFNIEAGKVTNIAFTVDSYKAVDVPVLVFLKSYDQDKFIPSYQYEKRKILSEGESKDNQISVDILANEEGVFELCIEIDDGSFFSINKYEDCPSTLKIVSAS